jgi:hypothetical protein
VLIHHNDNSLACSFITFFKFWFASVISNEEHLSAVKHSLSFYAQPQRTSDIATTTLIVKNLDSR